jgi:hypothetical protein
VSNLSIVTSTANADGWFDARAALQANNIEPGAEVGATNNLYRFGVTFP